MESAVIIGAMLGGFLAGALLGFLFSWIRHQEKIGELENEIRRLGNDLKIAEDLQAHFRRLAK